MVAKRVGAVLRVIDFLHQPGMDDRNVVRIEVVVDVDLPVAIDVVIAALGHLQIGEGKFFGKLRDITEEYRKRGSVCVEIDEQKLLPGFQSQRHHAHGGAIEKRDAIHFGRANQLAIQRVRPAVIGALKHMTAAFALSNWSGAMPANVAEGAENPFFVADNHHRLSRHIRSEKRFWIGHGARRAVHIATRLAERADPLPSTVKDAIFLYLQNSRISIKTRG